MGTFADISIEYVPCGVNPVKTIFISVILFQKFIHIDPELQWVDYIFISASNNWSVIINY